MQLTNVSDAAGASATAPTEYEGYNVVNNKICRGWNSTLFSLSSTVQAVQKEYDKEQADIRAAETKKAEEAAKAAKEAVEVAEKLQKGASNLEAAREALKATEDALKVAKGALEGAEELPKTGENKPAETPVWKKPFNFIADVASRAFETLKNTFKSVFFSFFKSEGAKTEDTAPKADETKPAETPVWKKHLNFIADVASRVFGTLKSTFKSVFFCFFKSESTKTDETKPADTPSE